ncbi:MAG: hypothetical protein DRG40_00425 [Deltaproteobacteria bacterium]|mgnify:CR=1 FL=1|nr:MAG: hypothetical protein DRG40_00425 [Deltaproteobacteria bacterium]
MQLSEVIARFTVEKGFEELPKVALEQAKMGVLDWIAAALAALKEEHDVKAMLGFIQELGKDSKCTVLGCPKKTTPSLAAFANGYIGHLLDYDETCPIIRSHLSAGILPAILAVAEKLEASGKDLLLGFVLGHEVALRIGEVMTPGWMRKGWHGTSLFGVFGATVGCGKLLGLNAEQVQNAIGIAASMASGIAANFGTMTKPLHAGLAARGGVEAAMLAKRGFSAAKNALDGSSGFYYAYGWGENLNLDPIKRLGKPLGLETPGVLCPKFYPCCHGLAINIEYGILIKKKYQFSIEDIEEIEIHSQPKTLSAMLSKDYADTKEPITWGYEGPPRQITPSIPRTGKEAKFSKEYAFARALLNGHVTLSHFTDQAVAEPDVQELMKKIKVFHNSDLEKISNQYPEEQYPHPERMIIKLRNGNVIEEEETFIQGGTRRPLSMEHIKRKFLDCTSEVGIAPQKSSQIIVMVEELENIGNISQLTKLLENPF